MFIAVFWCCNRSRNIMKKHIGVLTSGGDSPGLNAAIRGVGKAAHGYFGMQVIGFRDGFRGLMENRTVPLDETTLSGILTIGGTILGTSRDRPERMPVGGRVLDTTDVIIENYEKNHLDVLVCLGGGGTQKAALKLKEAGLNIITLPKTIDNDVAMTDMTFGFDTALGIATEAVDRLHSTAHSHHRIVVVEIMGHRAGWLTLGAGIAGGADVILIPEIPYDVESVANAIRARMRGGKNFSIVAVAEGALSEKRRRHLPAADWTRSEKADAKDGKKKAKAALAEWKSITPATPCASPASLRNSPISNPASPSSATSSAAARPPPWTACSPPASAPPAPISSTRASTASWWPPAATAPSRCRWKKSPANAKPFPSTIPGF